MKKIFCWIISCILMVSLCGCTSLSFFSEQTYTNAQDSAQEMADSMMGILGGLGQVSNGISVPSTSEGPYKVVRVVDGDTFLVDINGAQKKVRLIGVDTPESVATGDNAYKNCEEGKEASNYTKSLIEGKSVYLEFDVGREDNYGRLLAYAYLENGTMINKELLLNGYARLMTIQPNVKYVEEFKSLQENAKQNKAGFWDGFDQWEE